MVTQAFGLPKDKAGHGPSSDNTTEIVFRVADIIPAAAPSLTEYTEALKKRFGTSVNQAELDSAIGVSQE